MVARPHGMSVSAEMSLVVVDTVAKVESLLHSKAQLPTLTTLVLVGVVPADLQERASGLGVELVSFDDVVVI